MKPLKILKLAGLLFLLQLSVNAGIMLDYTTVEPFLIASGQKKNMSGVPVPMVRIPEKVVTEINSARKLNGKSFYTSKEVNNDPFYNRDYTADHLRMVLSEMEKQIGQTPSTDELFVSWLIGIEQFKKLSFDTGKIKDKELSRKLSHFRMVQINFKPINPPPLDTDNRKPIPTRYWSKPLVGSGGRSSSLQP